jgi:RND family efflux transporter MFP subunit
MKRMRFVSLFLVFVAMVVGIVVMRSTKAEPKTAPVAAIPVRIETVVSGSFRPERTVSGFVQGIRQTDVSPKIGGYAVKLLKEEGDAVRAGEPIAVLDGSELSAMNRSAWLSLDAARRTLDATKDFYDQTVDQAEASLRKAEESYDSGDITSRDLAIAKEAVKSAKRMRDAQDAAAAAGKAVAEGGALIAGASAANATVTAPFSGIVTRRYVSLGSFVAPGTPVYTVSSTDALEISVPVANSIMKDVRKGDTVEVTPEGSDTSVSGQVFSMAQAVGVSTQSSIARIRFADADVSAMLRPGQYVTVSIPVGPARDAILIPENAIVHEYDDTFVFTIGNGVATKTKISVGEEVDGRYEISSGLSVGEEVVIEGSYGLRDGESVTVSE